MHSATAKAIQYAEIGAGLIQGKGAGTGWDIASEAKIAARLIGTEAPILFDVGANVGDWSQRMLEVFPRCARLVLIEPQPDCLDILAGLDLPNKLIIPCAVSERPGELPFFTAASRTRWGAASLFKRGETYFSDVEQRSLIVPVATLDEIIEQYCISVIDFMKMDIEGAELLALRGAGASLRAGKIRALSFEFGSGNINSRTFFKDFWDFLIPLGFSIHRVLPGGRSFQIAKYYEDLEYFRGATNYIAVI